MTHLTVSITFSGDFHETEWGLGVITWCVISLKKNPPNLSIYCSTVYYNYVFVSHITTVGNFV